jgi:hypothetical protein
VARQPRYIDTRSKETLATTVVRPERTLREAAPRRWAVYEADVRRCGRRYRRRNDEATCASACPWIEQEQPIRRGPSKQPARAPGPLPRTARQARRLQLQAAWVLPIVSCAAHGADRRPLSTVFPHVPVRQQVLAPQTRGQQEEPGL